GWAIKTRSSSAIVTWTDYMFVLLIFSLPVVVSNSDQISQRVRRAIPRAPWKRFLAFFFFNGAAGGLLWVALMMSATALAATEIINLMPGYVKAGRDWLSYGAIAAYVFVYALTALFIQRKFLPNRPPKLTGLLAALIAAACGLMPSIILFFLNQLTWASIEGLELGNVFNVFSLRDESRLFEHFYFAFGGLILMMAINAPWFLRQIRNFVPPPKDVPPAIS
ncbi:MAG TPA: hypothetical protein VMO20_00405, partial [Candidatus Acidoferrum sp.]|nr:hypothetical protein [Candidatus Acidoferrum sp.]